MRLSINIKFPKPQKGILDWTIKLLKNSHLINFWSYGWKYIFFKCLGWMQESIMLLTLVIQVNMNFWVHIEVKHIIIQNFILEASQEVGRSYSTRFIPQFDVQLSELLGCGKKRRILQNMLVFPYKTRVDCCCVNDIL